MAVTGLMPMLTATVALMDMNRLAITILFINRVRMSGTIKKTAAII